MMNVQLRAGSSTRSLMAGLAHEPAQCARRVVLTHLATEAEIAAILHLREEIDLSVHAAAGRQQFDMLEKKETN